MTLFNQAKFSIQPVSNNKIRKDEESAGKVERGKRGMLENWKDGRVVQQKAEILNKSHPIFHNSIIPF